MHPVDKARSEGKRGGGPTTNEILLLTDEKLEGLPWAAVGRKWWTMRISTELRNLPGKHTLYIIHYTLYPFNDLPGKFILFKETAFKMVPF